VLVKSIINVLAPIMLPPVILKMATFTNTHKFSCPTTIIFNIQSCPQRVHFFPSRPDPTRPAGRPDPCTALIFTPSQLQCQFYVDVCGGSRRLCEHKSQSQLMKLTSSVWLSIDASKLSCAFHT